MRYLQKIALITFITLLALGTIGCGKKKITNEKMHVSASIAPLAYFARQVGGDKVQVELMVPPGANPHTYQLEPPQMNALSKSKVLVLNGLGLEFWADKAVKAVGNPDLIVVETAKGIPVIESHEEEEHGHDKGNPHVWLNPVNAILQVKAIRNAFIKADPANENLYKNNANELIKKLEELHQEIKFQTSKFTRKKFIAFHASWVYFAKEYGLEQAAVIEESPGKEPSPKHIKHVIDTARKIKARAIFAETQFSPKAAKAISEESGAKVLFLNPLGEPPYYDYFQMMRSNLKQMEQALR